MEIPQAYHAMLDEVRWADASLRQVNGLIGWADRLDEALRYATYLNARPAGLNVAFPGASTHRTWRTCMLVIITALQHQASEAETRRSEAEISAGSDSGGTGDDIRALMDWETAALDAVDYGRRVIANEEPVARLVFEGIARAGGPREVPADKRYAAEGVKAGWSR